jgi:putative endonuclease
MPSSIEEKEPSLNTLASVFLSSLKCWCILVSSYNVGFDWLSQHQNRVENCWLRLAQPTPDRKRRMPYMYILECVDGTYYTVSTTDLERRFYQHQNGEGANHTKKRLPVKLVYYEFFERVDNAFYREKQVQGWSRAKKQALIEKAYEKLPDLAWTRKGPQPP